MRTDEEHHLTLVAQLAMGLLLGVLGVAIAELLG